MSATETVSGESGKALAQETVVGLTGISLGCLQAEFIAEPDIPAELKGL